jgi:hypothetical protein
VPVKPKEFNMIKHFSLLLLAASLFAGCNKNKEDNLSITKENLIGKYILVAVEGSMQQKLDALYRPCMKDDEFELLAGDLYKHSDVGTQCAPTVGIPIYADSGNWELAHDTITFDLFTGPIKKLTKNTLVITNTYLIGFDFIDVKFTFNRK